MKQASLKVDQEDPYAIYRCLFILLMPLLSVYSSSDIGRVDVVRLLLQLLSWRHGGRCCLSFVVAFDTFATFVTVAFGR